MEHTVRAGVRAAVNHSHHGSEVIEHLIHRRGRLVVGAEYSLETGVVEFFYGFERTPGPGPTSASPTHRR